MKTVATVEELRAHYGEAGGRAVTKEIRVFDHHCRTFIAHSPFLVISSSDGKGNADASPKGDMPGFVHVLDDTTLAIPDRPGNNRLDTFENLIVNPEVGLLFLIPGMDETLRVNGTAKLTFDAELCQRFAVDGKPARSVMLVKASSIYMHCAKAFMRSKLWSPASWPDRQSLPTLGAILKDHCALGGTAEEADSSLADAYAKSMW